MPVVPTKHPQKIQFYEIRVPLWNTSATTIGLTTAIVTDLQAKTTAARAALTAQQAALSAAKAATVNLNNAIDALDLAGANSIKQIRATAERTNNPAIYGLAEIPPPATPSPRPAPAAPTDFKAIIQGDGSLELQWKCADRGGSVFQVYRAAGGSVDFQLVGGSGEKKFTDTTIPLGETQLTYKIQAVRTNAVGGWATFNVYFGTNLAGATTTTVRQAPARLAA